MSDVTISPNMSMPIPNVGVAPGPAWATDINACLSIIDGHNHSLGTGNQITPSGLDINSDLTMNLNNLTNVRTVRFTPQSSALSLPSDLGCIYEVGVDLYYNDGSGNQIRITQSGSVAGASGTITGLPSGTASASYLAGTFVFQSATNTPANVDGGSFIFRDITANSHGVTVSPVNSLAVDYSLVLPLLPSVTSILTLDASGNIAASYTVDNSTIVISSNVIQVPASGIGTTQLANGSVTPAKLANSGFQGLSLGAGIQTYSAAGSYTWVVPTNVTRVQIFAVGGGGGGSGGNAGTGGLGGNGCGATITWQTVTPAASIAVVVGAGGIGGVFGGSIGTGGGSTMFNGNVVSLGATGAPGSASTYIPRNLNQTQGGQPTKPGDNSEFYNGGTSGAGQGGGGGGGYGGTGGAGAATTGAGQPGQGSGAGGGGGGPTGGTAGNGFDGYIAIYY